MKDRKMTESPFEKGWWGVELPGARPCDGTYCYYPYESLPPLDESLFRGEFQWLTDLDESVEAALSIHRAPDDDDDEMADILNGLRKEAAQANLVLPPEFIRFMGNRALQLAIPSCTACEFDLIGELVPSVVEEGAYTLLFLRDQQDVLLWYLYLTPDGKSSVICSPIPFDEIDEPAHVIKAHTLTVAPSFEEFIYRFWIENVIWFAVDEGKPFTPTQKAYVDHYL
jgi:hypothetical protein